jgi:hypothetical protein
MPAAVKTVVRRLAQRFLKLYEKGIFIYAIFLNPSAIRIWMTRNVGMMAADVATMTEARRSRYSVFSETLKTGRKVLIASPNAFAAGKVTMIPRAHPVMVMT